MCCKYLDNKEDKLYIFVDKYLDLNDCKSPNFKYTKDNKGLPYAVTTWLPPDSSSQKCGNKTKLDDFILNPRYCN